MKRIYDAVGPFPPSIVDLLDPDSIEVVHVLTKEGPPRRPLQQWSTKQIPVADREFLRRVLKLDPRDRPSVEEIMQDEWFTEQSEDTRDPETKQSGAESDTEH